MRWHLFDLVNREHLEKIFQTHLENMGMPGALFDAEDRMNPDLTRQRDAARAMAAGHLVELETGEGKTYVAAVAAVALLTSARSVHVVTSNHYLATRDATALGPVYELLGLRSAVLPVAGPLEPKRLAYAADLLYATAPELGFDLLRDELADRTQPSDPAAGVARPPRTGERPAGA